MPKIHLLDVTNRDGVQTARVGLSKFQKTMLHWFLSRVGVHQSEMGFPFVPHEQNYVRANLALREQGVFGEMILAGWTRAVRRDVAASLPTGIKDLNISISTSDQMIRNKFQGKLDRESVIKEMVEAAKYAKEHGIETLGVNAEDASRTDLSYLIEFAGRAKEAGADRVRYCDTIGGDSCDSIYHKVHEMAKAVQVPIELHAHNDLGMAVANSISGARAANDAGVDAYINVTVNGIGERAGQADLLSTALALRYGDGMAKYEMGNTANLRGAWPLANYASYAFQVPIPINQPGVGANAFAHESGIHADGALKDRHNYELYDYETIGRMEEVCEPVGRIITTGEYGGLAGFKHVYDGLGIEFPNDKIAAQILELVQYVNAHNQLPLTDDELRFIAEHPAEVALLLTLAPTYKGEGKQLKAVGA